MNPLSDAHSIAVIGSGSWATAIVKILTDSNKHVYWHVRSAEDKAFLQTEYRNKKYLKQLQFQPGQYTVSCDLNEVISKSKWVVFALPSAYLEQTVAELTVPLSDKYILSGIKGILAESKTTPGIYFTKKLGHPQAQFLVLSGPSHAEEVAQGQPVFLTLGCTEIKNTVRFKNQLNTAYLRIGLSTDVFGIEYTGALKNIYALAAGIAKGLNLGDNFQSVLISKALAEMNYFLNAIFPNSQRMIYDTVYLGDLLVTAYSEHSRNRRFGELIGRGVDLEGVKKKMKMVAEGYTSAKFIYELKEEKNIQAPLIDCIYKILYNAVSARTAFQKLSLQLG